MLHTPELVVASHLTSERLPMTLPLRDEIAFLTSFVSRRTACSRFEGRTRKEAWGTERDYDTTECPKIKVLSHLCIKLLGQRGTSNAHTSQLEAPCWHLMSKRRARRSCLGGTPRLAKKMNNDKTICRGYYSLFCGITSRGYVFIQPIARYLARGHIEALEDGLFFLVGSLAAVHQDNKAVRKCPVPGHHCSLERSVSRSRKVGHVRVCSALDDEGGRCLTKPCYGVMCRAFRRGTRAALLLLRAITQLSISRDS